MADRKKSAKLPPVPIERGVAVLRCAYPAESAAPAEGLRFVCAGFEEVSAAYHVNRPGFSQSGVEFVVAGKGRLVLAGRTYALSPGVFFGYGPGIAHEIVTDRDDRLVKYFLDFSGKRAKALMAGFFPDGEPRRVSDPTEVREWLELLLSQGRRGDPASAAICSHLIRALELRLRSASSPYGRAEAPGEILFRRAMKCAEEQPLRFRSTEELARSLHTTPGHLCRVFKKQGGDTPYAVILRARMRHAAALLRQPGVAVKQVAAETGFADPYHFSRVFKRIHGIAPSGFAALSGEG